MDPVTLDQVFDLATQLPPADKLQLIERLVPQIAQALQPGTPAAAPFPVMTISAWPPDLPMRRKELHAEEHCGDCHTPEVLIDAILHPQVASVVRL